jgi:hypothetical protein
VLILARFISPEFVVRKTCPSWSANPENPYTVTYAVCAFAESGTIWVRSRSGNPKVRLNQLDAAS